MKTTTHIRRGSRIRDLKLGKTVKYKSVNQAKKWSRVYQLTNGGLGCGVVRCAR